MRLRANDLQCGTLQYVTTEATEMPNTWYQECF